MHTTIVIKEPLYAAVKTPIWRLPLSMRIFGCFFWTTVKPVLSTLKISEGGLSWAASSFSYNSKKIPTYSLLNPVALAVHIPVGWPNDSLSPCHFLQRLNQSLPAASLAIENGLGILFWAANWKANLLTSSRVHPKYFRSIKRDIQQAFLHELEEYLVYVPILTFKGSQFERT